MILDIIPWLGLGPLRFGMTPTEIHRILGEEHVYEDWMGGNLNDSLVYHGLVLGFDKYDSNAPLENARFNDIMAVPREDMWLFGKPVSSWVRQELVSFCEKRNVKPHA